MLRVLDRICKQHGKGLPLRIAHQGKWLSRTCFEVYLSLLRTEQKLLMEDFGTDSVPWSHNLCDVVITRHNLKCVPCDKLYKESMQEKLNKLGLIRQLYSLNLDTGIDSIAIRTGIEKKVFALSQGFVSKFQKFAMELMKTVTTPKKTNETHSLEQGLDGIYLKDLVPWLHNEETKHMGNDSIDPTVNSKISCKYLFQRSLHNHMVNTIMILTNFAIFVHPGQHGKYNGKNSKRFVKFVNKATFAVIQQLFPQAMTHRIRVKDGEIQPCSICVTTTN